MIVAEAEEDPACLVFLQQSQVDTMCVGGSIHSSEAHPACSPAVPAPLPPCPLPALQLPKRLARRLLDLQLLP